MRPITLAWLMGTGFGNPVVPLVKSTSASRWPPSACATDGSAWIGCGEDRGAVFQGLGQALGMVGARDGHGATTGDLDELVEFAHRQQRVHLRAGGAEMRGGERHGRTSDTAPIDQGHPITRTDACCRQRRRPCADLGVQCVKCRLGAVVDDESETLGIEPGRLVENARDVVAHRTPPGRILCGGIEIVK